MEFLVREDLAVFLVPEEEPAEGAMLELGEFGGPGTGKFAEEVAVRIDPPDEVCCTPSVM